MKLYILTTLILAGWGLGAAAEKQEVKVPSLKKAWAADDGLETPESVLYDKAGERLFVANMASDEPEDGYIAVLNLDGSMQEPAFTEGLNDPKGMGIWKKRLFVTDVTEVVEISLKNGKIKNKYPVEDAEFLNDLAIGPKGVVYVTDTKTGKIHKIKNKQVSTYSESSTIEGPNGLYFLDSKELLLGASGVGNLGRVNPDDGTYEPWISGIEQVDGIARDRHGHYFASNWRGRVLYVTEKGEHWVLLDTSDKDINAADIDIIVEKNLLLVPTFHDDRVVAYRIKY